jgi:cell division protein FtsQ
MTSSFFNIDAVSVEGNSYYTKEQVLSIAGDPRGQNLWACDLASMQTHLAEDPYIELSRVKRRIPTGVDITVSERSEACAVILSDGYLILDPDGLVLRKTLQAPTLTLLSGLTVIDETPGTALRCEENAVFSDTLRLVRKMEESNLWFREIACSSVTVRLYIYDTLVCEGTPENILNGMDSLEEVLLDLYAKEIRYGTIRVSGDGSVSFSPAFE